MEAKIVTSTEKLTMAEKVADDKFWFKEKVDTFDAYYSSDLVDSYGISSRRKLKTNYDLFNNILDTEDLAYVCKPFGDNKDMQLPAKMSNRDISSGKIKSMLGMEAKRPISWTAMAVNAEATTRKEQEETKRLREFVVSSITTPIRQRIEKQKMEEAQGRELTPQEQEELFASVEQELAAQTPDEVKKYMKREHQDPSEVLTNHLLNYLIQKCDLKRKFNTAFKHGMLSAHSIAFLGILNREPEVWVVNPMRFKTQQGDHEFIEDGDWAVCEYLMSPSEIVKYFNLTKDQVEVLYSEFHSGMRVDTDGDLFAMHRNQDRDKRDGLISVVHATWKSPRRIGFLTYVDELGDIQEKTVDETYELNIDAGDITIEWEWINEVYEGWKIKIGEPIYVNLQPIPGQFKDIDNIRVCKLPYRGVTYDNMNSEPTSLMDRLKVYQYYYNIVMYRLELLIASDKGKKVLMNIGSIPSGHGIDIKQWRYFFESSNFMWYDNSEEGSTYQDANTVAKVVDLSLASDIQKYIEIAEYLRRQAGVSTGVTDQVEGQIGPNDAVSNTRQSLVQSSHILEMYFELHTYFKRNVLEGLIELAKITYREYPKKTLSYILDDMSVQMFSLDYELLDNSTLGIFMSNSSKAEEAKETIRQLTHAALQNQKVELSDVISVIRQEGIVEAEETLRVAEDRRREQEQAANDRQNQANMELEDKRMEGKREEHEMEKELIILKEEERRKTVIAQAALTGASFNPDHDKDSDGENDFVEIAKFGLDAKIKQSETDLKREQFEHQKMMDDKKSRQEDEKLSIEKAKANSKKA